MVWGVEAAGPPPEGRLRPGGVAGKNHRVMQFGKNMNSTHRTGYWTRAWRVVWALVGWFEQARAHTIH